MAVAVVGAGLAGLTAAFRLQQAGVDVALFEANAERRGSLLDRAIVLRGRVDRRARTGPDAGPPPPEVGGGGGQ